ncbi:transposable element Tcb2 transposase [Trichonephila clavipes]|nr:transposable element Tcb2 transposase [Trichonephila clavipes]
MIVRQALADPTVTRSAIRSGVAIVPQTISRYLAEGNPKSKCPYRALRLTLNIGNCVYSGAKPDQCGMSQIGKAVFSDESRFVLGTDGNRLGKWRRPGERYNSNSHCPTPHCRTAGVMLWRAIAYDSRSTLIVMRETLTGQRYVDDILSTPCRTFTKWSLRGNFSSKIMLVRIQQELVKTLRHFQTLPWPTRFPDLSPVEHV